MSLQTVIEHVWFSPQPDLDTRRDSILAETEKLSRSERLILNQAYQDCFHGPPPQDGEAPDRFSAELASFVHALGLCEYGLDSILLLPPEMRRDKLDAAASSVRWPVSKFLTVLVWWDSSSLRSEVTRYSS